MGGIALAKFGIMPKQFYKLAPVEFDYALKDYFKEEERRERFELEKMRLQTLYLVNCQIKDQISDPRKLMPFSWDIVEVYIPKDEDWEHFDNLIKSWQLKQSTN